MNMFSTLCRSIRSTTSIECRSLTKAAMRVRCMAAAAGTPEQSMESKLKEALAPTSVDVVDVSGGCGSSYEVHITSAKFEGLSMIKQHRMVNEILREDVKNMHAIRIVTKKP
ncbi:hypothetical protein SARC_07324 [Sphaeroforma arctica JP610]|uniref:BolA protein n=1 Tax=Sphaeroforma arctica JP610 TaxID=667725 RepID=A0A0L0FUS0_9EUKA|nr:hypothetical protein SARC_07324 [Sphaeroforma arctica JP610]KNC80311.1 hypothetical protein SARC_07324 [Sphaeroforma arctica JP610]|eukprot:XP_014154213.1 hypothetical protein SARC_07324 [Sphaeroforma arctica JP610]